MNKITTDVFIKGAFTTTFKALEWFLESFEFPGQRSPQKDKLYFCLFSSFWIMNWFQEEEGSSVTIGVPQSLTRETEQRSPDYSCVLFDIGIIAVRW